MDPDHSQLSQRSNRKQQQSKDPVLSATLRQLQRLGIDMDVERMTESERQVQQIVESSRLELTWTQQSQCSIH